MLEQECCAVTNMGTGVPFGPVQFRSRFPGMSATLPYFEHGPHFEHVQVSRYGAFSSDNRLESMNKKYKDGLSLEKVPLSSPSPSLACRLMLATQQAVGQPSGAPLRRGVHHSPLQEKFAAPAAGKVRFCEIIGA